MRFKEWATYKAPVKEDRTGRIRPVVICKAADRMSTQTEHSVSCVEKNISIKIGRHKLKTFILFFVQLIV